MNKTHRSTGRSLLLAGIVLAISACSTPLTAPEGTVEARARLQRLQANADLASRAPIEIRDAEQALVAAERPERETALGQHLLLIADYKIDIAEAWAQSRLFEDQRAALRSESEAALLAARTQEADLARRDATAARSDATSARSDAADARDATASARSEADAARTAADSARNQARMAQTATAEARAENEALQREILELNARDTDRGLVVTLGDVMFETGQATLRGGITDNLDKLAVFLNRYGDRNVTIEGHTDSVGSDSSNQILSENRANSVQAYLASQGVSGSRMRASGRGESQPIASNDTDTGRQQNRRVEVIIANLE